MALINGPVVEPDYEGDFVKVEKIPMAVCVYCAAPAEFKYPPRPFAYHVQFCERNASKCQVNIEVWLRRDPGDLPLDECRWVYDTPEDATRKAMQLRERFHIPDTDGSWITIGSIHKNVGKSETLAELRLAITTIKGWHKR